MANECFKWEVEIEKLDVQVGELEKLSSAEGIDYSHEVSGLKKKRDGKLRKIYSGLGAWRTVQVARHFNRPVMKDYIDGMIVDFKEMHGDRCYGDDRAIVCGLGMIGRNRVMVIGNYKGHTIRENNLCNFGYANPEGFRKALIKMKFAEKFGIPIVTLIDTPGACPGVGAEERGQASAIAENLKYMSRIRIPIISVLVGEGGSGGALGICGGANRFGALEYAYYSVISPEGCAGILWRDGNMKERAAESLRLSAREGHRFGAIDDIINEPLGGAHRNPRGAVDEVKKYIVGALDDFSGMSGDELVAQRFEMINKRASCSLGKKKRWFSR